MAVGFPQTDKPSGLRGGSDAWDEGIAGEILSADYFETASGAVTHDASGSIKGGSSSVLGASSRTHGHSSTGALAGQLSSVSGASSRIHAFGSSGVLSGQQSSLSGNASRATSVVVHGTNGSLTGQQSSVSGTALRTHEFSSSGEIVGQQSTVSGQSSRIHLFGSSGALQGQGALIEGTDAENTQASFVKEFEVDFEPTLQKAIRLRNEAKEIKYESPKKNKKAKQIIIRASKEIISGKPETEIQQNILQMYLDWLVYQPSISLIGYNQNNETADYLAFLSLVGQLIHQWNIQEEEAILALML